MFNDFPEDNQNDDFLNEFRQKLASSSSTKTEAKQKEMQRSKGVFLGAATGIGLACAVGWFVLAPRYASTFDSEIPVVKRPQAAVKIKPAEPGGMEINNQDKSIYDIIDEKKEEKTVENLLPPPEEPKLPEVSAETVSETETTVEQVAAQNLVAQPTASIPEVAENVTVVEEKVEAQAVQNEGKEAENVSIAQASEQLQSGSQARSSLFVDPRVAYQEKMKEKQAADAAEFELAKAKAAEEAKAKAGIPTAAPTQGASFDPAASEEVKTVAEAPKVASSVTPPAPSGSWQIQLMSSKNKDAIEKSWTSLTKKYSVLANLPHEVETADIDFGSTFYRLKAGAFANKADADSVCNQIKAAGGSCLVKKK
ncbi:MAG: SPOR domain-containing protein [Alphaproteobacteria bacterium]